MNAAIARRRVIASIHRAAPFGVRALVMFSAAAVGAGLGRALVTTYLPVLLSRIRDAPELIGMVMLVNTVAGFAVPLLIGLWSDRLRAHGHGRTLPVVLGGSLVAAGGLAAIALGHASSYVALALFAGVTYVGLNAVTTGHRALIPENFDEDERGAATGGEELAMLVGTLAGVVAGGALIDSAGWAPFVLGATLLPLLAVPTVRRMRGRERRPVPSPRRRRALRYYARAAARPGARLVLAAQALWVSAYVGLPPFFVLYAERELGLRASSAALVLAGFGILTGLTMLAAGAVRPVRRRAMLAVGAAAMAGGLVGVAASSALLPVAFALLPVAAGFGVVSTLGFPVFSAFIPRGEEGAYSAMYFSVRALASAIAVPAAGWTIALSGSYRALFLLGALAAALAIAPLIRLGAPTWRPPPVARGLLLLLAAAALVLAAGLLVDRTELRAVDEELFLLLQGQWGTPAIVDRLIVDPHIQNYLALTLLTAVVAQWRSRRGLHAVAVVAGAAIVAYVLVRANWAVWERPRPQELLGVDPPNGHDWAPYASFPSGHVAVTVAIAVAAGATAPVLRPVLWAYAAVIALTRVTYAAHFPTDVAAGVILGVVASRFVLASVEGAPGWRSGAPAPRLRYVARASSLLALALFSALLASEGLPASPDGGVVAAGLEHDLQLGLLAVIAAGIAGAWWRESFGALVVVAAVPLGVFAAIEYTPAAALLACLAFFIPGTLFLVAWGGVRLPVLAIAAALLLAGGGVAATRLHDAAYGPAHPESPLRSPPTWRVHWVWAGAVTADGATVKARLTEPSRARLVVSRHADLRQPAASVPAATREHDIAAFAVRGLRPRTAYHYGVEVDGRVDPYRRGRFRTFDDRPFSFTFAAGGCARVGSNGAVFDAIRREEPLFFLILGDFFYGNIGADAPQRFLEQYDRALTSPAQGALYRRTPIAYTWDDHDYGGDAADSSAPSRPAALSAYGAAVPHYPFAQDGLVSQAFTVGRVRFVLTDTRSARTPADAPDGVRKTMLGRAQKVWLKRELRGRWPLVVWINSVPWIDARRPGADSWAGYSTERAELARFVSRHRPRGLLMLSADAHMLAIDDGTNSAGGFPVVHAGALDRRAGAKGGPYSEGAFPGAGQYATVRVRDDGTAMRVEITGRDHTGSALVSHTLAVP
ncbi:MAG TPA: MFS transporter [Solirubrobacteraceae bacterium]|nr:MFS transporter [Solirubrobacteraceae bacterium]